MERVKAICEARQAAMAWGRAAFVFYLPHDEEWDWAMHRFMPGELRLKITRTTTFAPFEGAAA